MVSLFLSGGSKMNEVKVTKIQIGLWNAIVLMVTFAIAAIPAAFIVTLFGVCFWMIAMSLGINFGG